MRVSRQVNFNMIWNNSELKEFYSFTSRIAELHEFETERHYQGLKVMPAVHAYAKNTGLLWDRVNVSVDINRLVSLDNGARFLRSVPDSSPDKKICVPSECIIITQGLAFFHVLALMTNENSRKKLNPIWCRRQSNSRCRYSMFAESSGSAQEYLSTWTTASFDNVFTEYGMMWYSPTFHFIA